jgi:hypothetical protein
MLTPDENDHDLSVRMAERRAVSELLLRQRHEERAKALAELRSGILQRPAPDLAQLRLAEARNEAALWMSDRELLAIAFAEVDTTTADLATYFAAYHFAVSLADVDRWRVDSDPMPLGRRMQLADLLVVRWPIYTPLAEELHGRSQRAWDAAEIAACSDALAGLTPEQFDTLLVEWHRAGSADELGNFNSAMNMGTPAEATHILAVMGWELRKAIAAREAHT